MPAVYNRKNAGTVYKRDWSATNVVAVGSEWPGVASSTGSCFFLLHAGCLCARRSSIRLNDVCHHHHHGHRRAGTPQEEAPRGAQQAEGSSETLQTPRSRRARFTHERPRQEDVGPQVQAGAARGPLGGARQREQPAPEGGVARLKEV